VNEMEDQPKPPQYVCALKLEFEDDQWPRTLYRVIGRGTMIECHVMAEKVPDVTYNGARPVKAAAVIVVAAPEIEIPENLDSIEGELGDN
jgi:hypothetical protein